MTADPPLRLAIFDVDGTLMDSRRFIVEAMERAFRRAGLEPPGEAETLGVVGLSLEEAMWALRPDLGPDEAARLAGLYRQAFIDIRAETGGEAATPLFPGARETLTCLDGAGWLLSIATGKARRGLSHALRSHGLEHLFIAAQTADDAPSKPHPGMVLNCLGATGVEPRSAVVVGDSSYDMEMARAAGVRAIGVAWGYQPPERLLAAGAERIVEDFAALETALEELLEQA